MATLLDYCALVRSKNAGPFTLTFDFMAKDEFTFAALCATGALHPGLFASLFHVAEGDVAVTAVPAALAIKVSLPRPVVQGARGDSDTYAGQQYGPLMALTLPELER
ncbi:DUF4387 domain-containing protein [Actinocorallia sp. A-T 12471]|uniref:DUF4387 domain-containing protein n=1 Tax=Actinocorallia sp. A-T 12471 TaxID=3089813 RepID=UPI0029CD6C2F|nr:DUF4387 domain-containing protein [Actinocorallia sp. A-T 12471]MDX6740657.1 DUF4387 domain-containing protein [Actinocorallia sp. A-T 12471]